MTGKHRLPKQDDGHRDDRHGNHLRHITGPDGGVREQHHEWDHERGEACDERLGGYESACEDEHANRKYDGAEHDYVRDEDASYVTADEARRERGGRMESERVVLEGVMCTADVVRENLRQIDRVFVQDARDEPPVAGRVPARGNERDVPQPSEPRRHADRDADREQYEGDTLPTSCFDRRRRSIITLRHRR